MNHVVSLDKDGHLVYKGLLTSKEIATIDEILNALKEEIPQIHLPVRTEKSTMEEILTSFIEAIFDYYAWIYNELEDGYVPDEEDVEEILQLYLRERS